MHMEITEYTDAQLLSELIRRKKVKEAPKYTHRLGEHKEVLVGIGKDYVAYITMGAEVKECLDKQAACDTACQLEPLFHRQDCAWQASWLEWKLLAAKHLYRQLSTSWYFGKAYAYCEVFRDEHEKHWRAGDMRHFIPSEQAYIGTSYRETK